ncbi:MAG: hypothetical protein EOO48_09005 [Flavobacterium sp.]|nr:MAG: hypothetical protein EOO48_09005 [Flavobacterium sp.]
MKRFLLACLLVFCASCFAQHRKGQFRLEHPTAGHQLYVAFEAGISGQIDDLLRQVPQLESLIAEYQMTFQKGIAISDEKLASLEANAKELCGSAASVTLLRGIYKIHLSTPDTSELLALAEKLERLPSVRYCSIVSLESVPPPSDIPPLTPNFRPNQTYYNANPGVNMQYAHEMGLTGTGIRIRDVEYGMNKQHEEFTDNDAVQVAQGMTISPSATAAYTEHGTAVAGILCADDGTYGITGLSHGASEFTLFPEWQQGMDPDRLFAISQSIENSAGGDVIIFEMQTGGATSTGYVMQEFHQVSWDLTKAATDAGITIVAAAGNGNQNLDTTFYQSYNERGDSGAIIVGAGTPDLFHNRVYYSTYGARVDVHGWSDNVFASGTYINNQSIGNDFNQNYCTFAGTSSATAIVSGCVVALQQYYFDQTGGYLLPQELRTLLKETGIAQGSGGNIGPLPNMEAAILALQAQLGVKSTSESIFSIYPNPAKESLNLHGTFTASALAEIIKTGYKTENFTFFCGNLRLETLPLSLKVGGIDFNEIEVYDTIPNPQEIKNEVDGILFFSPSAIESYLTTNTINDEVCFCIGETTAKALLGKTNNIVVANKPSVENVIIQCINHFK